MAPFYAFLCETYSWPVDDALITKMKAANAAQMATLEETIKDADENLGETEIREGYLAKAEYLCTIGDKEGAVAAFKVAKEKAVALGNRLDIVFNLIRLGMFYSDSALTVKNLELAQTLMDEGGDWDRRNRLKVYSGVHNASIREFSQASEKFLSTVSTFTSLEMMAYQEFVELTVRGRTCSSNNTCSFPPSFVADLDVSGLDKCAVAGSSTRNPP
jgi:26S proteasome regulatory subunit N7